MDESDNGTKEKNNPTPQEILPWNEFSDKDVLKKKVSYTHLAIINRLIAAQSLANDGVPTKKRNNRFIDSTEQMEPRELKESKPYYDTTYNIISCSGIENHDYNYINSINHYIKKYIKKYKSFINYELTESEYKEMINYFVKNVYFNFDDDKKVEVPGMRKFVNKYYDFLQENNDEYGDVNTTYWNGTIKDVTTNLYNFIKNNFGVVGKEDKDKDSDDELSVKSKFVRYMPMHLNEEKLPVYCTIDDYNRSEVMIKFINNDRTVSYYNLFRHKLCNYSNEQINKDSAFTGGKKNSRRKKRKSKRKSTKRRTKRKLRRKNTKK